MGLTMIILAISILYLISATAVYLYYEKDIETQGYSYLVSGGEIFIPIYNTYMAIQLWKNYDPYK